MIIELFFVERFMLGVTVSYQICTYLKQTRSVTLLIYLIFLVKKKWEEKTTNKKYKQKQEVNAFWTLTFLILCTAFFVKTRKINKIFLGSKIGCYPLFSSLGVTVFHSFFYKFLFLKDHQVQVNDRFLMIESWNHKISS